MDVCSLDWGAISTIIGAGIASATALYISRQWRDQKGSEVIANEAKSLFYDVCEHRKHIDYILNYEVTKNGLIKAVVGIENLIITINDKISFLYENIDDNERKYSLDFYKKSINNLNEYISKLVDEKEYENINDLVKEIQQGLEINLDKPDSYFTNYKISLIKVKEDLINISTYK